MSEKTPLLPQRQGDEINHESLSYTAEKDESQSRSSRDQQEISDKLRMIPLLLLIIIGITSLYRLFLAPAIMASPPPDFATQSHHHHRHPVTQLEQLSSHLVPTKHNNRRLLIVGDVHGCPVSLHSLMDKAHFDNSTDHLILTGDMINKGPDSHGALQLMRSVGASAVRGNHEDECLAVRLMQDNGLEALDESSTKLRIGAAECASKLKKDDIRWLAEAPLILELGNLSAFPHAASTVVVHAGLVPGVPLEEQDPRAVMNMRAISRAHHKKHKQKDKGKFVPEEGRNDGTPWFKVWNQEQELLTSKKRGEDEGRAVIYGHDSKVGLNERRWSIGLDSGCVKGERLSGLLIDHKHAKVVSERCKDPH